MDPVAQAIQRTHRHWYVDGLAEIATGCLFLLLGLLFFAEAQAPKGSVVRRFTAIALPVTLIGGYWIAQRSVKAIKARLTYPRAGYVAYARPTRRHHALGATIALAMGAIVAAVWVRAPASLDWVPLIQGVAAALLLGFAGHQAGLVRFYALAVLSCAAGAVLARARLNLSVADAIYFPLVGAALMVSGGLALARFLRQAPPAVEEQP